MEGNSFICSDGAPAPVLQATNTNPKPVVPPKPRRNPQPGTATASLINFFNNPSPSLKPPPKPERKSLKNLIGLRPDLPQPNCDPPLSNVETKSNNFDPHSQYCDPSNLIPTPPKLDQLAQIYNTELPNCVSKPPRLNQCRQNCDLQSPRSFPKPPTFDTQEKDCDPEPPSVVSKPPVVETQEENCDPEQFSFISKLTRFNTQQENSAAQPKIPKPPRALRQRQNCDVPIILLIPPTFDSKQQNCEPQPPNSVIKPPRFASQQQNVDAKPPNFVQKPPQIENQHQNCSPQLPGFVSKTPEVDNQRQYSDPDPCAINESSFDSNPSHVDRQIDHQAPRTIIVSKAPKIVSTEPKLVSKEPKIVSQEPKIGSQKSEAESNVPESFPQVPKIDVQDSVVVLQPPEVSQLVNYDRKSPIEPLASNFDPILTSANPHESIFDPKQRSVGVDVSKLNSRPIIDHTKQLNTDTDDYQEQWGWPNTVQFHAEIVPEFRYPEIIKIPRCRPVVPPKPKPQYSSKESCANKNTDSTKEVAKRPDSKIAVPVTKKRVVRSKSVQIKRSHSCRNNTRNIDFDPDFQQSCNSDKIKKTGRLGDQSKSNIKSIKVTTGWTSKARSFPVCENFYEYIQTGRGVESSENVNRPLADLSNNRDCLRQNNNNTNISSNLKGPVPPPRNKKRGENSPSPPHSEEELPEPPARRGTSIYTKVTRCRKWSNKRSIRKFSQKNVYNNNENLEKTSLLSVILNRKNKKQYCEIGDWVEDDGTEICSSSPVKEDSEQDLFSDEFMDEVRELTPIYSGMKKFYRNRYWASPTTEEAKPLEEAKNTPGELNNNNGFIYNVVKPVEDQNQDLLIRQNSSVETTNFLTPNTETNSSDQTDSSIAPPIPGTAEEKDEISKTPPELVSNYSFLFSKFPALEIPDDDLTYGFGKAYEILDEEPKYGGEDAYEIPDDVKYGGGRTNEDSTSPKKPDGAKSKTSLWVDTTKQLGNDNKDHLCVPELNLPKISILSPVSEENPWHEVSLDYADADDIPPVGSDEHFSDTEESNQCSNEENTDGSKIQNSTKLLRPVTLAIPQSCIGDDDLGKTSDDSPLNSPEGKSGKSQKQKVKRTRRKSLILDLVDMEIQKVQNLISEFTGGGDKKKAKKIEKSSLSLPLDDVPCNSALFRKTSVPNLSSSFNDFHLSKKEEEEAANAQRLSRRSWSNKSTSSVGSTTSSSSLGSQGPKRKLGLGSDANAINNNCNQGARRTKKISNCVPAWFWTDDGEQPSPKNRPIVMVDNDESPPHSSNENLGVTDKGNVTKFRRRKTVSDFLGKSKKKNAAMSTLSTNTGLFKNQGRRKSQSDISCPNGLDAPKIEVIYSDSCVSSSPTGSGMSQKKLQMDEDEAELELIMLRKKTEAEKQDKIMGGLSLKGRKAFYVVREILSSEQTFVDVLHLLTIKFPKSLEAYGKKHKLKQGVLSSRDLDFILGGLPILKGVNEDLLKDLEERVNAWTEDSSKVSDIFVKKGAFLKHYANYIKDFDKISRFFDNCCAKNSHFGAAVQEFQGRKVCQSMGIKSYMLKPVQRMPQYSLLLEDYLRNLEEGHMDWDDTLKAIAIVRSVAEHANETIRIQAAWDQLISLQKRLPGVDILGDSTGHLVKEGELFKVCRKELQPRYFALMNDSLLCMTYQTYSSHHSNRDLKLKYKLTLAGMKIVKMNEEDEREYEFSIVGIAKSFNVCARSVRDRDEWMKMLTDTINLFNLRRSQTPVREFRLTPTP